MHLPHLPIIKTSEQAVALAEQHQDYFYLAAFKLQVWISDLLIQAIAEYADKPDPAQRTLQTGQAWRAFQADLGRVQDEEFHHVINFLTRFSECENPLSARLLTALVPVYREHELSGDFLGPNAPDFSHQPRQAALLMRRSVERMCDWLDAVVHISTHILWFRIPACFDPDPEKRRLAAADIVQPYVAQMDEPELVTPYIRPASPPRRFRSGSPSSPPAPNSTTLKSEASAPDIPHPGLCDLHSNVRPAERPWPFPKLDEAIITLWPLLKLHNWTYADLWNVLCQAGIPLAPAPCQNHRHLAHYCLHALGLRKSGHGQTTRNSLPPGNALAQRLLGHFHRPLRELGCGPWS